MNDKEERGTLNLTMKKITKSRFLGRIIFCCWC